MTRQGLTAAERFWMKVDKTEACWLWTAAKRREGYGMFNRGVGLGMISAHRWSYQHLVGPVPDGLQLDHLCNVRHCVRPDHLEPVTAVENVRRAYRRQREIKAWRNRTLTDLELQEDVVSTLRIVERAA